MISAIAIVAALAGPALAANTISSTDIIDGEVKTPDLALDAVVSNRIANGQVKAGDLDTDAVRSAKIANGQVMAPDIDTNAVGFSELGGVFNPLEVDIGPNAANTRYQIADHAIEAWQIDPTGTFRPDNAVHPDEIAPETERDVFGIADDSIQGHEIKNGQVRAPDLGPIYQVKATGQLGGYPSQLHRTATCGPGDRVIGGGTGGNAFVISSYLSKVSNSWTATARNFFVNGTMNFAVYAYCLNS